MKYININLRAQKIGNTIHCRSNNVVRLLIN